MKVQLQIRLRSRSFIIKESRKDSASGLRSSRCVRDKRFNGRHKLPRLGHLESVRGQPGLPDSDLECEIAAIGIGIGLIEKQHDAATKPEMLTRVI